MAAGGLCILNLLLKGLSAFSDDFPCVLQCLCM